MLHLKISYKPILNFVTMSGIVHTKENYSSYEQKCQILRSCSCQFLTTKVAYKVTLMP